MTNQEIEDERRQGRIAAIAALIGILLFFGSTGLAGDFNAAESAEQLATFESVKSDLLLQLLLQALAFVLFVPALVSLFRSISARTDAIRRGLIGLVVAGPLLLAASLITAYFSYRAGADAFQAAGGQLDDSAATDLLNEQSVTQLRFGLGFAGSLGLAFATVYMSLQAMRAGLLTRFWGTLAMALGVGTLLFGSLMLVVFMLVIALLIAGWWPGSRPPAWDAGEAVPWPAPGRPGDAEPAGSDVADPEDFEGTATEVTDDPARPGRRDNKRKRKRKQRG